MRFLLWLTRFGTLFVLRRADCRPHQRESSNGYKGLGRPTFAPIRPSDRCSSWSWLACSETKSWSDSHWGRVRSRDSSAFLLLSSDSPRIPFSVDPTAQKKMPFEAVSPPRTRRTRSSWDLAQKATFWSCANEDLKKKESRKKSTKSYKENAWNTFEHYIHEEEAIETSKISQTGGPLDQTTRFLRGVTSFVILQAKRTSHLAGQKRNGLFTDSKCSFSVEISACQRRRGSTTW